MRSIRQAKNDKTIYDKEFPPLGTETQGKKSQVQPQSRRDKREPPLSQKEAKDLAKKMRGRPEGLEGEEDKEFPPLGTEPQVRKGPARN
ncbi:hypothetical protein CEP51_006021 [Fusarium floridanum]|uniref:Uncharacterized protein n=1 Tax=Fusarium floridanum TaxID=1325733 RepID=A0A428RUF4_9HYPO|nr:hypothetical protein CEP51_006021 [Fusarium floridanum]